MAHKRIALWLALALTLPVAACGASDDEEFVDTPPAIEDEARQRNTGY